MAWERKKWAPSKSYYYLNRRVTGKSYPVRCYFGRKTKANYAAAEVENRRQKRLKAKAAIQCEYQELEEANRLAAEIREWAKLLSGIWMILSGHYLHHGC